MTSARPNYLRDGSPLLLKLLTGFKMKSRRSYGPFSDSRRRVGCRTPFCEKPVQETYSASTQHAAVSE